jgi:membrane-bound lytic murein transglycosylase MltF
MQLLPSTAKDMGFEDLTDPEDNLHAGIKYMAWLRDTYFADPALSDAARIDFVLAAYNAGPGRVRRWRASAPDHGVDPNVWFGQVENLALESVGLQPVRYVGNVNKYCVLLTRWVAR